MIDMNEILDFDRLYADLPNKITKSDVIKIANKQAKEYKQKNSDVLIITTNWELSSVIKGWLLGNKVEQIRKNNPLYQKIK